MPKKISELSTISASALSNADQMVVVDISDTTMSAAGTNKVTTLADLSERFINQTGATTSTVVFATKVTGDAFNRMEITAGGVIRQGDGTIPPYESPMADAVIQPMVRPSVDLNFRLPVGSGNSTMSLSNGEATFAPLMVPIKTTLKAIGCQVTTGGSAGSVMRHGLYGDSTVPGLPGNLLVDFGAVATTATGNQMITSLSYTLQPYVLYWVCSAFQGATGAQATVVSGVQPSPWGSPTSTTWSVAGPRATGYTGVLPVSAGTLSAATSVGVVAPWLLLAGV